MNYNSVDVKIKPERTRYFDYHPLWLERFIERDFPHLIRRKYMPPYMEMWYEVAQKYNSQNRRNSRRKKTLNGGRKMGLYQEFPTLQAIEDKLDADIARIREKMSEVKKHPRYADNETERKYQLELLEQEYEETLAKAEDEFQTELKAIELHLAEQAFTMPATSAEELEKAQELANIVKFQLMTSSNIDDTLTLLKTRVKTMNDAEKQAVKMAIATIDIGENKQFKEILKELDDTFHMRSIKKQLEALKRIKKGDNSLRRKYDVMDKAVKAAFSQPSPFRGGGIGREFYEKYLKGGRK
ncbi:hypothetical protein [Ureibacillus terrenus]|uniref:hypothetical protein n=1 Tax=Ureibacillus terrenus TaxID=118246 RepID=UPI002E1CA88F|nr:hypothetical protein [Ureibacillus terrenus]